MSSKQTSASSERDERVLELYEQLLEIEQRLIPTGLHVFGETGDNHKRADMLRMVASFDRPEVGACSLPTLISEGLHTEERESVDEIARTAVHQLISSGVDAA